MVSFPPPANAAVYRDLLIFEERLKQNSARLKARKNKYQSMWRMSDTVFLALLCAVIMTLVYYVLYQPSQVRTRPGHALTLSTGSYITCALGF